MMTREDMMRELELLPVWQLRTPLPSKEVVSFELLQVKQTDLKAEAIVHMAVEQLAVKQEVVEVATKKEIEVTDELDAMSGLQAVASEEFTCISSDCGDWLFVMENSSLSSDEQHLFQNICKALRIKTKPAFISGNILTSMNDKQAKLLLVMGESTTQKALQTKELITNLRGKQHQLNGITLIATYDLAHLLQIPADKAKAWHDLCMGLQVLQDLKVANA